jgi:hypothetical protein
MYFCISDNYPYKLMSQCFWLHILIFWKSLKPNMFRFVHVLSPSQIQYIWALPDASLGCNRSTKLLDLLYLRSTMCWAQDNMNLISYQTQYTWVQPNAEPKASWFQQAARPNILGFNHMLSPMCRGSSKLLDPIYLSSTKSWGQGTVGLEPCRTQ